MKDDLDENQKVLITSDIWLLYCGSLSLTQSQLTMINTRLCINDDDASTTVVTYNAIDNIQLNVVRNCF